MNSILLLSQCSICFNEYNHQRNPLFLTNCGHTFCDKCLEKIFDKNKKEIICPICKLLTKTLDDNINNLPKNRLALDLISYNTEKSEKENDNKDKNEIIENKKINFIDECKKYEDITLNIEKILDEIFKKNSYIKENNQFKVKEEIDNALDNYINFINSYKNKLNKKIEESYHLINYFMKMNEINNSYKNKLNNLKDFINTETLNDELNINDKIDVMSYKQNEEKFKKYFNNLDIDNDIKALELNLLTVEDYKKKLFNPSIFLFVNKFQISKLTKELEKILKKTCDFDEKIEKYNINELNKHESSLFFLEIEKCSQNSNTDKIKYIFDHFYLNPNFTYISKRSNRNIVGCFDKYLKNFTEEENRNLLIDYLKEEYNYLNLENFDLTNMKKTLSGMNINLLKI